MAKKKAAVKKQVTAAAPKKPIVNPKKAALEIEIKKHEAQQEQLDNAASRQVKLHAEALVKIEKFHKDNLAKIKAKKDARQGAIDAAKSELKSL